MITLAMIHETLNELQKARDAAGAMARREYTFAVDGYTVVAWADVDTLQAAQAQFSRLAMSWHDVVRGCRTDEDLAGRLGQSALVLLSDVELAPALGISE